MAADEASDCIATCRSIVVAVCRITTITAHWHCIAVPRISGANNAVVAHGRRAVAAVRPGIGLGSATKQEKGAGDHDGG